MYPRLFLQVPSHFSDNVSFSDNISPPDKKSVADKKSSLLDEIGWPLPKHNKMFTIISTNIYLLNIIYKFPTFSLETKIFTDSKIIKLNIFHQKAIFTGSNSNC